MIYITKNQHSPNYKIDQKINCGANIYEIMDFIGCGGNSSVYECINQMGIEYAIKFQLVFSEVANLRFEKEIAIMLSVQHAHIIKIIDHGNIKGYKNGKKEDSIDIKFIIMEKADMNLREYLMRENILPYSIYAAQLRGLAEALGVIHEVAFHRDIKPENILIKGDRWLISDFGLCKYIADTEDITGDYAKIGPKFWMSPEAMDKVMFGTNNISTYSDVYQLSAIFWLIINRKYPLGIISEQDWKGEVNGLFKVLYSSLHNNCEKRPKNGKEFYKLITEATIGC